MRHKRAKVYKRAIGIYTQAFGFRQPFQVLVSNDILLTLNRESDIHKQLSACVQGEIKPMITQCCVEALYKLGKEYQAVVDIAKTFERRRCNHREAISPDECLKDIIGTTNKHRYVLCAQSKDLRQTLSAIPGLPVIHFNPRHVLVLSPPSHATLKHKDAVEEERRLEGADVLLEGLVDGENVVGAEPKAGPSTAPKRNRVKGPNPLSVKKRKDKGENTNKRSREEDEVGESTNPDGEEELKKKKKRKRPQKGIVKQAIAEIHADFARAAEAQDAEEGGEGDDSD